MAPAGATKFVLADCGTQRNLSEEARDQARRIGARARAAAQDFEQPTFLITHQVNITALSGVYPRSGEILIVAPEADGGLVLVDRLLIK